MIMVKDRKEGFLIGRKSYLLEKSVVKMFEDIKRIIRRRQLIKDRQCNGHNKQEKSTKINPVSNKQAMHAGFAPVVYNPTKTGCLLVFLDKSNKQLDLQDRKFMTVSCMKNTGPYT